MALNPNKLPVVGPWARKITRIYRLTLVDCVPNGFALIYGQAVAAFHIVWSIVGPDCVDRMWDRVTKRPRGHRRFLMKGDAIGPWSAVGGGPIVAGAIAIGNMVQKIGFFFALVDGLLKGVMYGTSMVYRYSGCANAGVPYAQFNNHGNIIAAIGALPTPTVNSWQLESYFDCSVGPTGVGFTLAQKDYVTVVLSVSQATDAAPPLPDAAYTIEVYDQINNTVLKPSWTPFQNPFAKAKTLYSQDYALEAGYHELVTRITKTVGVLKMDTAYFTVTIGKLHDPIQAWKCGGKQDVPVIGPGPSP